MSDQPEISQEARMWAYASYVSIVIGLPLCAVPLVQRTDAFALYHAKHAAAAYVLFWVLFLLYLVITVVTCGLGTICVPMILLPYVPMIHGFVLVYEGKMEEPIGLVGGGELLFGWLKLESK